MELQSGISLAYNRSRVGSREKVIVDSYTDGILVSRSRTESPEVDGEILVNHAAHPDPAALVGQFVDVSLTGADEYDLSADLTP